MSTSRSCARPASASTNASTGTRTGDFWLALSARTRFVHVPETIGDVSHAPVGVGHRDVDGDAGDARILAQRDAVLARGAERRDALDARHDALKRDARAHEAAGRLPQAAAAWVAAHQDYQYDAEPLLRYAELALRAGDARAARAIVDSGLSLLPYEPALHRVLATILRRAATGMAPPRRSPGPRRSRPTARFADLSGTTWREDLERTDLSYCSTRHFITRIALRLVE
jgi:hypothetical protein